MNLMFLYQDQLDRVKQDLVDYFFNGAGRECEVDSMYFQLRYVEL